MAPLRGLFAAAAGGSSSPRPTPGEEQPPTAPTEENGGIMPDWSSETGDVELGDGGYPSAPGDPFHAGVLRLLSMHSQVQEEVTHLRDVVAQYECKLKNIQSAIVCGSADEPEMAALMEMVSREMAVPLPEGSPAPSLKSDGGDPGNGASDKLQDARDLTGRPPRSNEGTFQVAALVPLTPPLSPRPLAVDAAGLEQPRSSEQLPSRHVMQHPFDDDLNPRTALAMGAQDYEEELAILEDDALQKRPRDSCATLQPPESIPRSSGSAKGPAEVAATPVGDDAPPKIQVRASVGEDEQTRNRNTLLSINAPKAGDLPARVAPQIVKSQGSGLMRQKTRPSLVPGGILSIAGGDPEDMPIARRLSKERAAVLTPASRRVLNKMKRKQQTDENGDVVEVQASPFFKVLRRVVGHPGFDLGCASVIIANSALIGLEVNWKTFSDGEMPYMKALNYVCTVFFFVELIMRMALDGLVVFFMRSENRSWNVFDAVLVGMSLLDAVIIDIIDIGDDATGVSGGLKTLKMLRIVRVCRVFRFFGELSQLALMIIDSVKSLIWALIMLFIVIYVFSIFFIHGCTPRLRSIRTGSPTEEQDLVIVEHFGDLGQVIQTLFQSMLNGISWYTLTNALRSVHWFWGFLFFFYIAFTMLAVLNIITGVFVDNAVETARTQREYLVQKEMELKEKWCQEMRNLFNEMDADGSGTVCLNEVRDFFKDDRVRTYFIALGLETQDAERLFILLDEDEQGDIDIEMFLNGCLRLKGTARSIDVYQLLQDYRKMNNRLLDLQEAVGAALKNPSVRPSLMANRVPRPPRPSNGGGSKDSNSRGGSLIVKQAG